ncbi:MAG: trypsin-like peptidase domain-containing protein [Planctomycetes bacterium]|nr:trypsin-like peptidase domain-containing protein [Planctomycetota bacterium]
MTTLSSFVSAGSALVLLGATAAAQTSLGGLPVGLVQDLGTPAPVIAAPTPDVAAYLAEDEERRHRPLRYGALVGLGLDLADGTWTTLRDGSRVWRIQIVAPGAKSVALEFDQFELPEGARLYVYDEEVETVLGAYTRENRHEDGSFVFEPFPGERLTLELDLPAGAPEPLLRTSALIHDYRDIFGLMSGAVTVGGSDGGTESVGACLIDVNCPQGASWENQKRATLRTLSNGALCSGALLNNTANDATRYVLTADHCGQTTNTVFTFRYQTSGCSTGGAPTNMTVSGCTVLTTSGTYDSRLLRITPAIPNSYQPYYAGWSRSTQNATMAFALGHPSGGPKKISIDGNGTSSQTTQWRVTWSQGTLEGGSSGGPLFDQNGRVRGPACCVNDFVCSGQTAYFGKFSGFYTANALAQWLDPAGLNPTTLNGFDPLICALPTTTCFTSPNSVGPGATISIYGSQFVSENDFNLQCVGLPPNSSGIFFYGPNETFAVFGNGFRCVGNPLVRLPVQQANTFGDAHRLLDLTTTQIQPGQTRIFQYWYRNPAGGGAGFNLSDAIVVPFCL